MSQEITIPILELWGQLGAPDDGDPGDHQEQPGREQRTHDGASHRGRHERIRLSVGSRPIRIIIT